MRRSSAMLTSSVGSGLSVRSTVLGFVLFVVLGVGAGLLVALVVALVTAGLVALVGAVLYTPVVLLKAWSTKAPARIRTIHAHH